jgi:hypothetical protein
VEPVIIEVEPRDGGRGGAHHPDKGIIPIGIVIPIPKIVPFPGNKIKRGVID